MNCYKCSYPIFGGKTCSVCHTAQPKPRTQKGIGIEALSTEYPNTLSVFCYAQQEEHLPKAGYPLFARPAPSTPKHGYIDSRVVKSLQEAKALLKEVLADDPNGELILCHKINAEYNTVWTPSLLSIGKGHDGATSGTNQTTIPLTYQTLPFSDELLKRAKITEQPFVEAVYSGGCVTLTQLRNGPKTPSLLAGDYIPEKTVVQEVIIVNPEEYKDRGWEIRIEQAIGKSGVVVWHPNGSINDHFSVHAFTAGIPIIFSDKQPLIGDVLQPLSKKVSFDPYEMMKGVVAGEFTKIDDSNWDAAVRLILLALHNSPAMVGQYSRWIGIAASMMLRLGCTALRGEARHFGTEDTKKSREEVYNSYLNRKLPFHQAGVNRLINIFRYGKWKSAGFGGPKWAACGASTLLLFNAVRMLSSSPTEANAGALVRALNLAVNQAHNGGWWLNKFCGMNAFTELQNGELNSVLSTCAILYEVDQTFKSISDEAVKVRSNRINKWSNLTLCPPKTSGAKLTVSESGSNTITLAISAKLLGKKSKAISATVSDASLLKEEGAEKTVFLVESEDGYRLEKRAGGDPVVIWTEPPLMAKTMKSKIA